LHLLISTKHGRQFKLILSFDVQIVSVQCLLHITWVLSQECNSHCLIRNPPQLGFIHTLVGFATHVSLFCSEHKSHKAVKTRQIKVFLFKRLIDLCSMLFNKRFNANAISSDSVIDGFFVLWQGWKIQCNRCHNIVNNAETQ